ncbi:SDR family NAD(P)-dependent oxidoreductase [Nitratireductor sp. L1-7-SE]|uniref:SDR family NAD(P)-dependent oxidoreductase n=1 Tax=Nitratireductor rhodophyticola TaxID=2854036 RepID=A0ABS7RAL3_9HYPH|nr:SDR family NAD(P)-dependent oxidoreductase [Nitratireductor rhodophyticola]MBY8917982.1 SDR family NAD(P)-dependent oxidoreductase [Nitratireductor rhodophyticola]MBY8921209.1 SDR family NAD(P)-dependent oxidoreductase [Nitratireductor rhodophyticola]
MTLPRRTALITGANKGIGFAIATGLAREGFQVWLGSRDPARGEIAAAALVSKGHDVRPIEINVADDASVAAAAARLGEDVEALHVLVNNAGIIGSQTAPPSLTSIDDMKAVYEVNVFGPVRVTQAFLPLLKQAGSARVVMMSSGLASLGLVTDPTSIYSSANLLDYNSSKTALNAVTVSFAKELEDFGIKVNAVEPGNVATALNGHTGALSPEKGAESAIRLALIDDAGPTGGFFAAHGRQPW